MLLHIDTTKLPQGTVLLIGIRYLVGEDQVHNKVFTYAVLLAGGRWWMTGTGKVPQDAGWGAVQRWLDDPRREVVWIRMVTGTVELWPGQDIGGNRVVTHQPDDYPVQSPAAPGYHCASCDAHSCPDVG